MTAICTQISSSFFPIAVQGIVSQLQEEDSRLIIFALKKIEQLIDIYWAEISDSLLILEDLSEREDFPERHLASYLASKCYYHLVDYENALRLALCAGEYFNIDGNDEYTQCMMFRCIDEYTARRQKMVEGETVVIDSKMEMIIDTMITKALASQQYSDAIGLSIDSRKIEKLEECIVVSNSVDSIKYVYQLAQTVLIKKSFRSEIYNLLVRLLIASSEPDYSILCHCYEHLQKPAEITALLTDLIDHQLIEPALQLAFDLYGNGNHQLLIAICNAIKEKNNAGLTQILNILNGEFAHNQYLSFLWNNNHSDMLLMKELKDGVEKSSIVLNHATIIAHSIMNCGTTNESFLRNNQSWLKKSSLWSQFSATCSIGVIHRGHVKQSRETLKDYLAPSNGYYCEGGALYALGIIHSNSSGNDEGTTQLILEHILANNHPVTLHGACLGFGLINIASGNQQLIDKCREVYLQDDATSGEAAGYSLGLLLCGLGTTSQDYGNVIQDMLAYAHETDHEKIIRGLSMGVALSLYGSEDDSETVIRTMTMDSDPVIRYGGAYAIGLAYCGTGNNKAIQQLLHIAVSDVNDDVRRAAVTCLGFIMIRNSEQLPQLVGLLSESYNPYVRYGACIALGIACCNTNNEAAVKLITPMLDDKIEFVRQGAFIAMGMLLIQQNSQKSKAAKQFREKISTIITDPHGKRIISTFGVIIGAGILDVGGRNCNIQLLSPDQFLKMDSIVGLTLGLQYWSWFPLIHCLCLSFQPTTIIGVNNKLEIPSSFTLICNAKQSSFQYPEPKLEKEEKKISKLETVELSTTKQQQLKKSMKEGETPKIDEKMEETPKTEEAKPEIVVPVVEEPDVFTLHNPCRVTYNQLDTITIDPLSRYTIAVKSTTTNLRDFIVLIDSKPELGSDTMISVDDPNTAELPPPQPFEWQPPPFQTTENK